MKNSEFSPFFHQIHQSPTAFDTDLTSKMHLLIYTILSTVVTSSICVVSQSEPSMPAFAFSWLDDKDTFHAGDFATIKIRLLGNMDSKAPILNLTLTVNERMGNSCYISGVSSNTQGDPTNWSISFIPILAGLINLLITDDYYNVFDSSLHFHVLPGPIYSSACVASWRGLVNEFVAGEKATVLILPKDAFGNNISSTNEGPSSYKIELSTSSENDSVVSILNHTDLGWTRYGYIGVEFIVATAGNLLLHIERENHTLNGSPFPFKVNPGPLNITKCLAKWKYETNSIQIFSRLEILVHQLDQFGNLVSGLYDFDAQVVEKETNLSIPIADLVFEEVAPGIQLFSFSMVEPGDFWLTILDIERNQRISSMPSEFTVFVGYCDGLNSVINGSGLLGSVAGEQSGFSVYLEDKYHNPSPVEVERLRVQIARKVDSYNVWPSIYPIQVVDALGRIGVHKYGANSITGMTPAPSAVSNDTSPTNSKAQASAFNVIYTPEKSGTYEVQVFCGNIPLNGGGSHIMEVRPGEVDTELSKVVHFAPKVPKMVEHEILVQLVDSFSNPVFFEKTKLSLGFRSNNSGFLIWTFVDNQDGYYISQYIAKDIGAYEMCVSYEDKHLSPCTFWIYTYNSEYFPKAYNDTISVWEDESISFDVLGNDYFAGGNVSIVEIRLPSNGSLLQYGRLFRYTPFKGFFGNDTFTYTILDINNNNASGTVFISVLITPPQFLSLPVQLQATEDMLSPRSGGFPGIEITYSDPKENFSVILSAKFGTIFLAPMLMQFWQPTWTGLFVDRGERDKRLILVGCIDVINSVLQSIQYLGNENFFGDDSIRVSTINVNGAHDIHIPLSVEPINDPPFIIVPEFIVLENKEKGGLRVFDRKRDKFEFFIGDPDLSGFPGTESQFMITLSIEVNNGILATKLPAALVNTTELKIKDSYQWQSLQTFVTISKHFSIKAKGVRFYGTIKDCNEVMQHLLYQGGGHGTVLTITVNDMGNYGRCVDCSDNVSLPLFTEASVHLITRRPMSSLAAQSLGSAIVTEFVAMFFLGSLLLFFICKCAYVLGREKRSRRDKDVKLLKIENSQKKPSTDILSENAAFTGSSPSPSHFRGQLSNFRQRSRRQSRNGESSKEASRSSQSSIDHIELTPLPSLIPINRKGTKRICLEKA